MHVENRCESCNKLSRSFVERCQQVLLAQDAARMQGCQCPVVSSDPVEEFDEEQPEPL